MNKKLFVSVSIFPLLMSCHGNFIDLAKAKERFTNIKDVLTNEESPSYVKDKDYRVDNLSFNKVTYHSGYKTERNFVYNESKKYFSEYFITKNDDDKDSIISERRYYMIDSDNVIYDVTRSTTYEFYTQNGSPVYYGTKYHFENKSDMYAKWESDLIIGLNAGIRSETVTTGLSNFEYLFDLIEADNGIYVHAQYQSFNNNSLYIGANFDEFDNENNKYHHEYEIDIDNLHIKSYNHEVTDKTSKANYDTLKIDYGAPVDRIEPDLSMSSSHIAIKEL